MPWAGWALLVALWGPQAVWADTATASPTSCTSVTGTGAGTVNWSSLTGPQASDNNDATVKVDGSTSRYLQCTGYGFTLPPDAIINGITVNVERNSSSTANGGSRDAAMRLVKAGVIGSTDRATATTYTTTDVVEAHGGAGDLWGDTWTAADINAANFGAALAVIKADATGGTHTVSVDHIQIVVNYTIPPMSCTQPANTPAGLSLTCVCDDFARASLNPSPIFGSNWITSTSDSTGIVPRIVNSGYLRLTDSTGNNAKAATVPGIFPAAGNYISVEFKLYAYNGNGADGVGVTLSDYAVPPVPGAFGGSLGYAQKIGINGFAGGWLGVALDEFGNYANAGEGRQSGAYPAGTLAPQSIGARGAGSGTTGYNWLGGAFNLSPNVDSRTSTKPAPGHIYQVIVDARNEPSSTSVQVNRDIGDGNGYQSQINIANVYTAAKANGWTQSPVPANWQVSFTGSTGGQYNIHELSRLRICAQTIISPTGGVASGFNAIDEAYGTPPAVSVQNYLTGHIYTKLVGTPFKLNVAALNNSQIQTAYVVSGTKNVTVKLVDNSDGACVLDSAKANYCSSTCTGKAAVPGGSQTLAFATANAGQKQSADFTLNTAYRNLVAIISDGSATACSTDAFAVRPTGVSAVAASGTFPSKAGGDTFTLTATIPGVAANASGYTGQLKINNDTGVLQPVSPATVAGAVVPAVFPAAVSATPNATATGTTFTYSEVGAFTLPGYAPASDTTSPRGVYDGVQTATECSGMSTAQCDALKLASSWTGVDSVSTVGDCVSNSYSNTKDGSGKYGCNFGLVANTASVGRFYPHHFDTEIPANACGAFTYSGQPFRLKVTAKNASGGTTLNYTGLLAKNVTYADANGAAGSFSPATLPAASFLAGVADLTATAQVSFTYTSKLTAPSTLKLRATDTDGASSATGTEGTTPLRSGRLRLSNVFGTEKADLHMPVQAQYWSGLSWVLNSADSCTVLPATAFYLTSALSSVAGGVSLAGGTGSLALKKPAAGATGSVDVAVDLGASGSDQSCLSSHGGTAAGLPWLRSQNGSCAATYDRDPSARATFGVYAPETRKTVYIRELF